MDRQSRNGASEAHILELEMVEPRLYRRYSLAFEPDHVFDKPLCDSVLCSMSTEIPQAFIDRVRNDCTTTKTSADTTMAVYRNNLLQQPQSHRYC